MSDKKIVCAMCGNEFDFTAGEQEFYAMKNLNDPKNCKDCRQKRRMEKDSQNKRPFDKKSNVVNFNDFRRNNKDEKAA